MKFTNVQEYLNTGTGTAGTLLFPKNIYKTLIPEVDKALIPRTEAALYMGPADIPGSSITVDFETPNKMKVRKTAEGGSIWLADDEWQSVTFTPVKYSLGLRITSEFEEDNKFPGLVTRIIGKAGKRFAENETSLILTALQSASNSISGGSAITIPNITRMMQYLEDSDYEATSFLHGNEILYDLRNIDTFVDFQKVGNTEMLTRGYLGNIYGMNCMKFSTNAAPSSTYSKYAYAFDKSEAYGIAEKRLITVKSFDLDSHDMKAVAITQRLDIQLLRDSAIARVTTS